MSCFISGRLISRLVFEQFLRRFINLRMFELNVQSHGSTNLSEADQWSAFFQQYLPRLSSFDFRFVFLDLPTDAKRLLTSFRDECWLNRFPRSYVALNVAQKRLCTVPRFLSDTDLQQVDWTTVPSHMNEAMIQRIIQLDYNEQSLFSVRLKRVKRLIVHRSFPSIRSIDLSTVEHLILTTNELPWKQICQTIEQTMPRLRHVSFRSTSMGHFFSHRATLRQIHQLDLVEFHRNLHRTFPCLQRLQIRVEHVDQIVSMLVQHPFLSLGTFDLPETLTIELDQLRSKMHRQSFTYRLIAHPTKQLFLWLPSASLHDPISVTSSSSSTLHGTRANRFSRFCCLQ
jgi:hypothetical protein